MYRKCARQIISLAQPWVCSIVRGKPHANTEFGAKLYISLVDGFTRIKTRLLSLFLNEKGENLLATAQCRFDSEKAASIIALSPKKLLHIFYRMRKTSVR